MSRVILVVDDSPTMRGMVSHALNEAGFETKEAENGKDALIKLTMMEVGGTKPDVIVTDVNMIIPTKRKKLGGPQERPAGW